MIFFFQTTHDRTIGVFVDDRDHTSIDIFYLRYSLWLFVHLNNIGTYRVILFTFQSFHVTGRHFLIKILEMPRKKKKKCFDIIYTYLNALLGRLDRSTFENQTNLPKFKV